jgi:site-specific recombinase XerD
VVSGASFPAPHAAPALGIARARAAGHPGEGQFPTVTSEPFATLRMANDQPPEPASHRFALAAAIAAVATTVGVIVTLVLGAAVEQHAFWTIAAIACLAVLVAWLTTLTRASARHRPARVHDRAHPEHAMTDEPAISVQLVDVDDELYVDISLSRLPAPASVRGELVAAADEFVDAFALTDVASAQTQRTYQRACRRFVRWLGPLAGPEDLTATAVARYHAYLVAGGRSSATVKKDRAAVNSFLRWLAAHDKVPAAQARAALAVRLPRAQRADREAPKALDGAQYERLLREAKARIADDTLRGVRDHAILLVLGDGGLRCEAQPTSRSATSAPPARARRCAPWTSATAKATARASSSSARARHGRSCAGTANAPAASAPPPTPIRLFITVGRRGRDGSYQRAGARCSQAVLAEILKTLGPLAELPDDLCHPHALRHTCATQLLQHGANVADVRRFLGHASVKTTSIYLASDDTRQEEIVTRRARGRSTLAAHRETVA